MNLIPFAFVLIRMDSSPKHISDIDRDVVVIAISYFDRNLSKRKRNMNRSLTQLVAMTSLYLAVKLHSTKKVSVELMSR